MSWSILFSLISSLGLVGIAITGWDSLLPAVFYALGMAILCALWELKKR